MLLNFLKSPVLSSGLSGYMRYVLWSGGFSLGINVLALAIPLYSMLVYDRVLASGSGATLGVLTVAALAGLLTSAALDEIRTRLLVAIGLRFDSQLASKVFERQLSQGAAGGGQAVRDLDTVRHLVTGSGTLALFDLPWAPLFIAACFYIHPWLGMINLIGAILVLGLAILNQVMVAEALAVSGRKTELSYRMTDGALMNGETIRALGMLPQVMKRWSDVRGEAVGKQAEASTANAAISSVIKFLRFSLQILIMGGGAWLAVTREISPGALYAASLISARALMPIDQIVGVWKQIVMGFAALGRVEAILAEPDVPKGIPLPRPEGRVVAEGLSYQPPGARAPILQNISFKIEPGDAVGIVGPSAAGKSTLARLIVGALKPTSGTVRLDGAETWSWRRDDFGQYAGYVAQNVELFEGTIAENIARFQEVDGAAIVTAAKLAGVHEMILALPQGYETRIAQGGAPLSGGQRQRIALARAVFGDVRIMVLDEPNSNLDGEGELALATLLNSLKARGVTTLMVAHRPSVLATLDKVLVLRGGTVSEFGPIEQVMPRIAPGFSLPQRRTMGKAS